MPSCRSTVPGPSQAMPRAFDVLGGKHGFGGNDQITRKIVRDWPGGANFSRDFCTIRALP